MECYEILNNFFNNYRIDIKLIPQVIELFSLRGNILYLSSSNKNIRDSYLKESNESTLNDRRLFYTNELAGIERNIYELRSLKQVNEEYNHGFLDGLIKERENIKEKILKEQSLLNDENIKKFLLFNYENNRKNILLSYLKIKDLEFDFERQNKSDLFKKLNSVIKDIYINSRFSKDETYQSLMEKIELEKNKLDFEYMKKIKMTDEIDLLSTYKDKISNKDEALSFLNDLYEISAKASKPLSNNDIFMKISEHEHRLFSLNIYSYLEKTIDHDELKTYYVILKNQLDSLNKDINSEEDQKEYLKNMNLMLNTIQTLNNKTKPLQVEKNIFEINSSFERVQILKEDPPKKYIRYEKEGKHYYSIVENKENIYSELSYWKEQMNYGYDRYYKDNFYKEVEDTFNLTKFYYRFRSLIIYSNVLKKETHDDSSILNDENIKQFDYIKEYLIDKIDELKIKGKEYWKKDVTPKIYFSNMEENDKDIIYNGIIPENGIGREIGSEEMLKSIYGVNHVREFIVSYISDIKENNGSILSFDSSEGRT